MKNKIVGTFNEDLSKIELYKIIEEYKYFTIIQNITTLKFYAWDNKKKVLSDDLHIIDKPRDKNKYNDIIAKVRTWYVGTVFFWADSKFVTEYGLPYYDKLVDIYKELITFRISEVEINESLKMIMEEDGIVKYLYFWFITLSYKITKHKSIKKMIKEYKLIW